jgi:hypothetical protein
MASILPSYLADLASAFADKSADRIASLVPLHPAHQAYRPLQSALNSVSLPLKYLDTILTLSFPSLLFRLERPRNTLDVFHKMSRIILLLSW